jgi:hypothetical protein
VNTSEATKIIAVLRKVYTDQTVDRDLDSVWAMVFDDVPYEPVMLAVQEYLKAGKPFFPKPGEIRTLLIERFMGLPAPEEAWSEVMRAIREHGSYRAPLFSCAAIAQAVDTIGWRTICMSEEIGVERAHFYRTYQAYRDRAVKHVDVAALVAGNPNQLDWSNSVNHGTTSWPAMITPKTEKEWWESDGDEVVPTPITATNGEPF